jgi:hypothetical protein
MFPPCPARLVLDGFLDIRLWDGSCRFSTVSKPGLKLEMSPRFSKREIAAGDGECNKRLDADFIKKTQKTQLNT